MELVYLAVLRSTVLPTGGNDPSESSSRPSDQATQHDHTVLQFRIARDRHLATTVQRRVQGPLRRQAAAQARLVDHQIDRAADHVGCRLDGGADNLLTDRDNVSINFSYSF